MSQFHPSPQTLRGMQLKDLGRYADAARAFRESLANEPNDAFVLHQLAACQLHIPEQRQDALATVRQAIAIEPNEADHHVLQAFILCTVERAREALASARAAIALDPTSSAAFTGEAQALLLAEKWAEAEKSARQALALDADNGVAANQLAQALRLQNKMSENAQHLAGMLARDPDDAYTHSNAGWAALQRGERLQAETHFREALRLDPEMESAREGLLTSFRARSPLFRGYLNYCFFMQRLSAASRWGVILGLYFASRIGSHLKGGLGLAVVVLYFLFALWIWVARPFGNLMLLFDPFAKYALRPREKIEATVVGGGLVLGLALFGASFAIDSPECEVLGLGLIAAAFPLSMTFTNGSVPGTWLFGTVGAVTVVGAICAAIPAIPEGISRPLFLYGCFACLACTWLGNVSALRKPLPH